MPFSEMLHCITFVRIKVSEEPSISIIRVTRPVDVGTSEVTSSVCPLLVTANVIPA
jgi:hypothetical protein